MSETQKKPLKLRLGAAIIIGMNAMIGAGIFSMPGKLALLVGPASFLSFLIAGLMVLAIVYSLGRLAQLYPGEAWGYEYPARWGGHLLGMVTSLGYVSGVIIGMGFLTQQAGVWLMQYLPFDTQVIGIGVLLIIMALVLAGTQISTWGQYVIAACVLAPLAVTSTVCWSNMQPALMAPLAPYGYGAILAALPIVMFNLFGFESIASLYRLVYDPARTVPLAAFFSVTGVVLVYTLFVSGAMFAIPLSQFANGVHQAFSDVLVSTLPQYGYMRGVITLGAFFAIFGTLHSMVWSLAELLHGVIGRMRNSLVKKATAKGYFCFKGCVILVVLATALCSFVKADVIFNLTAMLITAAYGLSVIALFFNAQEWKSGRNLIAIVSLLCCAGLFWIGVQNLL